MQGEKEKEKNKSICKLQIRWAFAASVAPGNQTICQVGKHEGLIYILLKVEKGTKCLR